MRQQLRAVHHRQHVDAVAEDTVNEAVIAFAQFTHIIAAIVRYAPTRTRKRGDLPPRRTICCTMRCAAAGLSVAM